MSTEPQPKRYYPAFSVNVLDRSNADQRVGRVDIDPGKYDSFYWTYESIRKFLLPYYVIVGDLARAEEIRKLFDGDDRVFMLAHKPGSSVDQIERTGVGVVIDGQPRIISESQYLASIK